MKPDDSPVSFLDSPPMFEVTTDVLVIGAGACGLIAALTAQEHGATVIVLERDSVPAGSTSLSSGMIPACKTRLQADAGVDDSVERLSADIMAKNHDGANPTVVRAICREVGPTVDWLVDKHDIPLRLVDGFLYPGHTVRRMHAPPGRTGAELIGALTTAAARAVIDIITDARVDQIIAAQDGTVAGVRFQRPDGQLEELGCRALILACSGFGGNAAMVAEHLPEMAEALYFGHTGNQGDAVRWGMALGAATGDMTAYQGHGSVAIPHGALITWALMMEGAIQVNSHGERFSDEHGGYSEQAVHVLAQADGIAWNIFDTRLDRLGRNFDDYRAAADAGAVLWASTLDDLVAATGLPAGPLSVTLDQAARCAIGAETDPFGRDFTKAPPLEPPYCAIRVTGALFHTQGGLEIDGSARVLRPDGGALPNLLAGGGAARGISGAHVWGYLSGNGLLAATALGRIAGREAAALAKRQN
ncbi:MAG: FAD-dependent oxidoreductase [Rhodospirillaceae bacterium]|nr:FAD-dependent oxidoreductase [Rhodospirillaceae bacterium]